MSPSDASYPALLEEAGDIQADAMRTSRAGLADLVERGRDLQQNARPDPEELQHFQALRRVLIGRGLSTAGKLGVVGLVPGLFNWLTSPRAAAPMEVQAAQTAAAFENLAVAVYKQAAALPFMQSLPEPAGTTVTTFVTRTIADHVDHAGAFNAAATKLGGKAQTGVDQALMDEVVTPELPKLTDPLKVVNFAAELEYVAAQTFAAETAAVSDQTLRSVFSSISGVENQHRTILLAVGALLQNDLANQIKIPPDAAQLPAAAGDVGFPESFLSTDQARPADEGAHK
ncbi:MAG: ferritin-like domain-containing protein [Microthrixaceae bacterium]